MLLGSPIGLVPNSTAGLKALKIKTNIGANETIANIPRII